MKINLEDFTEDLVDRVRYFLLDYIGVAARGAQTESSFSVQKSLAQLQLNEQPRGSTVLGTSLRADLPMAALFNGTAAHSLELDDVINEASLHPGVVIMPAVLATAEFMHSSIGQVFEAIVTGYEVMTRLGNALNPAAHYRRGFHPTGTCGALGAAVAVGKIMKLNQEQLSNALGIAGSQASGSLEFLSDGAYTKRFHAGWAAHSGLMAAFLAKEGFTGPSTILEGKFGFLHAYSLESSLEPLLDSWGTSFALMRTSIKPHACCRYKQGPIDGILRIMQDNQLKAEDVDGVSTGVLEAGYALVAEPLEEKQHPQRVVDAQFSMPFGAAVAMHFGKAGLDQYTEEVIQMPVIQDLMKLVTCEKDPALDREFPKKWPASVKLVTKKGQTYSTRIDYPKGDPENPLTWDELAQKFHDLTVPVYDLKTRTAIVDTVRSLNSNDALEVVLHMLRPEDKADVFKAGQADPKDS
ncbi:MAG: MmgE/PrpD family protein [Desulfohalobiaceae bacterium]|nr:MmgE/PrpD family protein [Desulfohalobiaceae bacterium]